MEHDEAEKKLKLLELGREMYEENIYIELSIFIRLHNLFYFVMSLFRGSGECLLDDYFSLKTPLSAYLRVDDSSIKSRLIES